MRNDVEICAIVCVCWCLCSIMIKFHLIQGPFHTFLPFFLSQSPITPSLALFLLNLFSEFFMYIFWWALVFWVCLVIHLVCCPCLWVQSFLLSHHDDTETLSWPTSETPQLLLPNPVKRSPMSVWLEAHPLRTSLHHSRLLLTYLQQLDSTHPSLLLSQRRLNECRL